MATTSYLVAATSISMALLPFTVSTGTCTTVLYTLTTFAGGAIDSTVFTYDSTAATLTISTSSSAKIGTYSFKWYGILDGDL